MVKRLQLQTSRRVNPKAFSLVEVVIVVGIMTLTAGLLLTTAARVRESARRTIDLSNLRQLALACSIYAADNRGLLPPGRLASAAPGADDYTWINNNTCWRPLMRAVPKLSAALSCQSILEGDADADDFGAPQPDYGKPGDLKLGWIYWGGRDDLLSAGAVRYRSPRRIAERLTPGSTTLWTCLCWDSAGGPDASECPHVGLGFRQYPSGVALIPPPDGLGVSTTDGAASFVPWGELGIVQQANGYKLYYKP